MSYINPAIRYQFETLSIDLKNEILSRDVTLTNMREGVDFEPLLGLLTGGAR